MKNKFDLQSIVRKNVKHLKPYSTARDEFKGNEAQKMLFLDANENPFENGVNRYPDPQQKNIKKRLSEIKNINSNQILLGNGSDEVLDLIFRAFCEPNKDAVITLPPTYGMYGVLANINAVENKEVLLTNDFELQTNLILETITTNTKIIFICSPNNPSGNSFNEKNIDFLIQNFNGLVVIDEAYIDFTKKTSWIEKLEQFPNLIVTQTLSKAYGLAGLRLGILYASHKIISILNKIKPPYNVNQLTQQKVLERLYKIDEIKNEINSILNEKNKLVKALLDIDFVKKIYPSESNFILIKVDDANKRYDQLIKKGVVIRNRNTQPLCENCLRLTVGTPEENTILINELKILQNNII